MIIGKQEARITPTDIAVLKAMFEEREGAVDVIRKIFYPELTADAPLHANHSMYTERLLLNDMSPEQKVIAVESHQKLVQHVEGRLQVIAALIGRKDESPEQVLERIKKDSGK